MRLPNQTLMPPTPQAIMRRANTSRIASALSSGGLPQTGFTGARRQTDPLTMPPTPQPSWQNPGANQAFPYEAFQRALAASGRAVEHIDPMPPEQASSAEMTMDDPLFPPPDLPPITNPGNVPPIPIGGINGNPFNAPPTGGFPPDTGGLDPVDIGNTGPGYQGGQFNQPRGESVVGGLVRRLPLPYGLNLIPQIYHTIAERNRAAQNRHAIGGRLATAGRTGGPTNQTNNAISFAPRGVPGTGPGQRYDYTQGRYVTGLNDTGAQHNNRMSAALRAWDVGRHQPTNLRQPDHMNRGLGMVGRMGENGFEQVQRSGTATGLSLLPARGRLPNINDPNFASLISAINARTARRPVNYAPPIGVGG